MRQRDVIGTFLKIAIDETYHTYARIIDNHVYAFYDCKTQSEISDFDLIEKSGVLFKLIVHRSAKNKGGWKIIGKKELPDDLKAPVPFFKQEIGRPDDCSIYLNGEYIKVSQKECEGLERLAVWEDHHVQQRLIDHYNGVVNMYWYATTLNGIL